MDFRGDVVGVDACPSGWVAVTLRGGAFAGAETAGGLSDLLARVGDAAVVAVDMPLGLLESGRRARGGVGRRPAGGAPLAGLPGAAAGVWEQPDYDAANACCRRLTGRRAFPPVVGAGGEAARGQRLPGRRRPPPPRGPSRGLLRGHGDGAPVAWSKKGWNGQAARRRLLEDQGIVLPDDLGPAGRVPSDDVLDAAAAAWSAHRIALGTAVSLPAPPETSDTGLPVAIWY